MPQRNTEASGGSAYATPLACNSAISASLNPASASTSSVCSPSWGGGSNGLGIVDSVNFKELKIPLSGFGVTTGTQLHVEFWQTTAGPRKGPHAALFNNEEHR